MSPILGIYASSMQPALNASSYESIATVTASGGESTLSFTSIPSTYKHLQIRYLAKNSNAGYYVLLQANNDTGSNYSQHQLIGNGSTASASGSASSTAISLPRSTEPGVSNVFSAGIVDILDYTNTNKYKTIRALGGKDTNTANTGYVDYNSGAWLSTSAITSLKFSFVAGTFNQYSTFALYGIKG